MLQDMNMDYEYLDLPVRVVAEQGGDGFYVRAFGGLSVTPSAATSVSSSLGIGKSQHVGSRSLAIVTANIGLGHSAAKAFASLL